MSDKVEIPDEARVAARMAIAEEVGRWPFDSSPPHHAKDTHPAQTLQRLSDAALEAALPLLPASGGPAVDRQVIDLDTAADFTKGLLAEQAARIVNRQVIMRVLDQPMLATCHTLAELQELADALVATLTEQPKGPNCTCSTYARTSGPEVVGEDPLCPDHGKWHHGPDVQQPKEDEMLGSSGQPTRRDATYPVDGGPFPPLETSAGWYGPRRYPKEDEK